MKTFRLLLLALSAGAFTLSANAQHGHLDAGATGQNQGDRLIWANGDAFLQSSGYVRSMTLNTNPSSKFEGFFAGNISLTALHLTDLVTGEPVPNATAPGSFIVAEIVSVTGPEGGSFSFWETNATKGNPSITLPTGIAPVNARFDLSDPLLNAGQPGADPFGHIHGRSMTASKPGIYSIGFRAIDTSTNGAGGGPIHAPSEVLRIYFQHGVNLKDMSWANGVSRLSVGATAGQNFRLQTTTNLADALSWTDLGEITGNDHFQTMTDESATNAARFYRVQVITP